MSLNRIGLIAVLTILLVSVVYGQRAKVVVVDVDQNWSTGILGDGPVTVNNGEEVWFFARGFCLRDNSTSPNAGLSPLFEWFASGPGGLGNTNPGSSHPLPGTPANSLIGRIGTSGDPFYIGSGGRRTVKVSGTLYFRANDSYLGDNAGYFVVLIYAGSSPTSVNRIGENWLPSSPELFHNYPNPFNPSTDIEYTMANRGRVTVDIYDVNGKRVRRLLEQTSEAGRHRVTWDGLNDSGAMVSSGTYFYQIRVDGFAKTKKMLLLK